jgi:hypothetical protein
MWMELTEPKERAAVRSRFLGLDGNLRPEVDVLYVDDFGCVLRLDGFSLTIWRDGRAVLEIAK